MRSTLNGITGKQGKLFRTLSRCTLPRTTLKGLAKAGVEDQITLECQTLSKSTGTIVNIGNSYDTSKYNALIYNEIKTFIWRGIRRKIESPGMPMFSFIFCLDFIF